MNNKYIQIAIIGILICVIIILSLRGPKIIIQEKPIGEELIKNQRDSIERLNEKIDILNIQIKKKKDERIKVITKYKYIKKELPNYSNDSLDSLIFMEPR
jgi:hypothetical protein